MVLARLAIASLIFAVAHFLTATPNLPLPSHQEQHQGTYPWPGLFPLRPQHQHMYSTTFNPHDHTHNNTTSINPNTIPHPSSKTMLQLRQQTINMFLFAYDNYVTHALPLDNLKPISCSGSNAQGGVAFTLLDSLDSLILLGQYDRFQQALAWLNTTDSLFDVDQPGHVFELTIRAMGGLLSSHIAIINSNTDSGSSNKTNNTNENNDTSPQWSSGYNGELLQLAEDLARRLLPAFNTLTGLPAPFVNLKHGAIQNQDRSTCTACAGTLYLEWATLSMLTGDSVYKNRAKEALAYLHKHRSRERGLVGNTINIDTGRWTREDGGIGAGIDSYYEYLLKGYLLTGDEDLLEMFSEEYAAVTTQLQLPHVDLDRGTKSESDIDSQYGGGGVHWLVNANMHSGKLEHGYIWSVSAFWPALQILAGQVEDAKVLHHSWMQAWERWGEVGLPEMFEIHLGDTHPSMASYPLRPELIESTYMLYGVTGDEELLQWGAKVLKMFEEVNKVKCGYAHVEDVGRRKKKRKREEIGGSVGDEGEHSVVQLQDDMESFFLSETLKYLYLLFSMEDGAAVVDEYVLTTEAHFLPPFVDDNNSSSRNEEEEDSAGEMMAMTKCQEVCLPTTTTRSSMSVNQLLLRQRRCKACLKVNKAMEAAKKEQSKEGSATDNSKLLASVKALLVRGREEGGALQQHALTASGRRLIKQFLVSLSPTSSSISGDDLPPSPATIPHHDTTTSIEQQQQQQQQASSISPPPPSSSQQVYGPSTIEEVPPLKPSEKWLDELPSNYVIVQVSQVPPSSSSKKKKKNNNNSDGGRVRSKAQMVSVAVYPGGNHDSDNSDSGVWEVLGMQGDIGQPPLVEEGENDGRRRRIVKGRAVLAYPIQACTPLTWNPTLPTGGSIVIVARGSCSFSQKLHYAKKAGAVAMIVVSNEEWLMPMGHSPDERYEEDDGDIEDGTDSNGINIVRAPTNLLDSSSGNSGDEMPVAVLLPKSEGIAVAELVEKDLFLELELATIREQTQPSSLLSEKTIETADICPLNNIFEEEDVDGSNSSSSSEMCYDNNATKQQQQQQEHTFYLEMMVPAKSQGWLAQRLQNQQLNLPEILQAVASQISKDQGAV